MYLQTNSLAATENTTPARASGTAVRLEVTGLSASYGSRSVFAGVEFSLVSGDSLVVGGRNGAGKSTLLRILAGLTRPTRGRVSLKVETEPELVFAEREGRPEDLCRRTGIASPEIELYDELTAAENLSFYARLRDLPLTRTGIRDAIAAAGLKGRADERVGSFSSGMKQRLRLLFAIQHTPALLLLDEPGSNLDTAGREFLARVIEEHLRRGILVLATNDPDEIRFGQQMLRLDQGT